jgi:hypothetical protein
MRYLQLALLAVVALLAWLAHVAWRKRAAARAAVANDVRRVMLQTLVGELREALAAPDLTPDDVEAVAARLIAQMETYNVDGQLDAFIADNADFVAAEIAARRARAG